MRERKKNEEKHQSMGRTEVNLESEESSGSDGCSTNNGVTGHVRSLEVEDCRKK